VVDDSTVQQRDCPYFKRVSGRSASQRVTLWSSTNPGRAIPASLIYQQKPAWWPTGTVWPWVGPDLTPMVGVLPAKQRSDSMP